MLYRFVYSVNLTRRGVCVCTALPGTACRGAGTVYAQCGSYREGDREYSTCIDSVILTGRGSYIYIALPVTSDAGAGTRD